MYSKLNINDLLCHIGEYDYSFDLLQVYLLEYFSHFFILLSTSMICFLKELTALKSDLIKFNYVYFLEILVLRTFILIC